MQIFDLSDKMSERKTRGILEFRTYPFLDFTIVGSEVF